MNCSFYDCNKFQTLNPFHDTNSEMFYGELPEMNGFDGYN